MADIFTAKQRSEIMSKVRATETTPEIVVRKFLFSLGFRFRKNDKKLPGKPDIVLPKYKAVIFVHGCFWHGHKNCEASALPKTNIEYWSNKIARNIERDKGNVRKLKKAGLKVIMIWECETKKLIKLDSIIRKLRTN